MCNTNVFTRDNLYHGYIAEDSVGISVNFKAFRVACASVEYLAGVSMKDLLDIADWTISKFFFKFYLKESVSIRLNDGCLAAAVLKS